MTLKLRLENISALNEYYLKGERFSSPEHLDEIKKFVCKNLTHSFFNPLNRTECLGTIFQSLTREDVDAKLLDNVNHPVQLVNPSILSPVFDKYHLSLRVNPTESKTFEGSTETSTRDFLLNTYHWSTLFSTKAIRRLKLNHIKCLDQFKTLSYERIDPNEFNMDIGFFNVAGGTQQRSQWQWIRYKDIEALFKFNDSRLIELENQYQFFSLKGDKPMNTQNEQTQITRRSKNKRLFILFVDSLDIDAIRQSPGNRYKHLKQLIGSSTLFNNFTSSGDWTVPCLDALHTGYSPENTLSAFRSDPYLELFSPDYLAKIAKGDGIFKAINSYMMPAIALLANRKTRLPENLLTNRMESCGFKIAGIKTSMNHSWSSAMTPGLTYSMEYCSHNKIKENLSTLFSAMPGHKPDICFIDIDLLHGCHGYRPDVSSEDIARPEYYGPLHWIGGYATSDENLIGNGSENEIYKQNYLRKLDEVDKQIEGIMDEVDDNDQVIIWSDHGSMYFEYSHRPEFVPNDSPAKINKIWKPTLLIKSDLLSGLRFCDELVSTVDLYQIILKLSDCNLGLDKNTDSILPRILGGEKERLVATTFSTSVRKIKSEISNRFYLINRYPDQKAEVYQMDTLPNHACTSLMDHNKKYYKKIYSG